jgi:hypothetical protein
MAWDLVADCVPHRALLPPAPEGFGEADERWVHLADPEALARRLSRGESAEKPPTAW